MPSSTQIKPFSKHLPLPLAILEYYEAAVDLAIQEYREHTQDRRGLAHIILTEPEYALRYPNANNQPVQVPALLDEPPALPDNATAGQVANSNRNWDKYKLHQAAIVHIENQIENGYLTEVRASIEDNGSLRHLTLAQQFVRLKTLYPLTTSDFDWLKQSISTPFPRNGNIATATNTQLTYIRYLAKYGQPLSNIDAIARMFQAHQSTAEDRLDYVFFMTAYQLEYSLQRRTPENYVESIIKFVNDVLPNHRKMNETNRVANQVILTNERNQ